VVIQVERPEGIEHLSEDEWRERLKKAMADEEQRARVERRESPRKLLGRKSVLRTKPTDRPDTVERRRGLRPHIACLNKAAREAALKALSAFRAQRTAALLRTLDGALDVAFPLGTYRIRGFFSFPLQWAC
jgi:hypothetical protein